MRVDGLEVEVTGDQEDDGPDRGNAREAACTPLGGLEQAIDGLQETYINWYGQADRIVL